jgi:hypothetical protein
MARGKSYLATPPAKRLQYIPTMHRIVEPEPDCVTSMRCLCACHAAGLASSEPCDTNEQRAQDIADGLE